MPELPTRKGRPRSSRPVEEVVPHAAERAIRELQTNFGSNVNAARIAAGLTQRDLADRVGMPQQYLSRIEMGHVNLTLRRMSQLATALGQDVVSLLSRPTPPKSRARERQRRSL